jgi:PAS domain S-box-containing protein
MNDQSKTHQELVEEISFLKQKMRELEQSELNLLQTQATLKEREEHFRAIANYTYDWENWIGPDGRLIWVNPAVLDFTGYSVNECLNMSDFPFPLIHETDRERMRRFFSIAIQGTAGSDTEFLVLCKDRSIKWASVSIVIQETLSVTGQVSATSPTANRWKND